MQLYDYYRKLKREQKIKFFEVLGKECRVRDCTIYSWLANPTTKNHRTPKPVYKAIISTVTGIAEEKLFPEPEDNQLPTL